MLRVLLEVGNIGRNPSIARRYEFACVRESVKMGESPICVSLQHSLISDLRDIENSMDALTQASNWLPVVEKLVLYTDMGMTGRMEALKAKAKEIGVEVTERSCKEFITWAAV